MRGAFLFPLLSITVTLPWLPVHLPPSPPGSPQTVRGPVRRSSIISAAITSGSGRLAVSSNHQASGEALGCCPYTTPTTKDNTQYVKLHDDFGVRTTVSRARRPTKLNYSTKPPNMGRTHDFVSYPCWKSKAGLDGKTALGWRFAGQRNVVTGNTAKEPVEDRLFGCLGKVSRA